MSHKIVKLFTGDDYEPKENPVWCLSIESCGDACTLCSGEYYGEGASACEYEVELVEKGGITCPECLKRIKWFKAIDLDENSTVKSHRF